MPKYPLSRQLMAEFLGTLILLMFGIGVNAQVSLSEKTAGDYLSINFGWGIGVTMGIFVSGGISGAHLNPAVTLAMAVWRGFSKAYVLPFILAQLAGALVASTLVYVVYYDALTKFEQQVVEKGGTATVGEAPRHSMESAGVWATYPASHLSPIRGGMIDQVVGTTILLVCIMAIGDRRNSGPGAGLAPFAVGLVVIGIGVCMGFNCGYAINPVRDFGPRLFTYFAGWGPEVFRSHDNFWWVPIAGPCIGGVIGVGVYDWFILPSHRHVESDSK